MDKKVLAKALEALRHYDWGSSRAALVPIDEAVSASLKDEKARREIERLLSKSLLAEVSPVAKEYICGKLALVGTDRCVSELAANLASSRPEKERPGVDSTLAARNALEAIRSPQAARALRKNPKAPPSVGIINSLGTIRDDKSVPIMARILNRPEAHPPEVVAAAVAALGNIGGVEAANVLLAFMSNAPVAQIPIAGDACLMCAERLAAEGKKTKAQALYQSLGGPVLPQHIRRAADNGLERLRSLPV